MNQLRFLVDNGEVISQRRLVRSRKRAISMKAVCPLCLVDVKSDAGDRFCLYFYTVIYSRVKRVCKYATINIYRRVAKK